MAPSCFREKGKGVVHGVTAGWRSLTSTSRKVRRAALSVFKDSEVLPRVVLAASFLPKGHSALESQARRLFCAPCSPENFC
jgi:hypothetical protein